MNAEILEYYAALQSKFRECGCSESNTDFIVRAGDNILTPLPIDPRNPERGLWGMVDWGRLGIDVHQTGHIYLFNRFRSDPYFKKGLKIIEGVEGTPELALLKALAYQWGVEVKE